KEPQDGHGRSAGAGTARRVHPHGRGRQDLARLPQDRLPVGEGGQAPARRHLGWPPALPRHGDRRPRPATQRRLAFARLVSFSLLNNSTAGFGSLLSLGLEQWGTRTIWKGTSMARTKLHEIA